MKLIDQFEHIKCRTDFFAALSRAISETEALLARVPNDPLATATLEQLRVVEAWTRNNRNPTRRERWSLTIGTQLVRELETVPDLAVQDWKKLIMEVTGYFRDWLDDETFATIDDLDLPDFEDDDPRP